MESWTVFIYCININYMNKYESILCTQKRHAVRDIPYEKCIMSFCVSFMNTLNNCE